MNIQKKAIGVVACLFCLIFSPSIGMAQVPSRPTCADLLNLPPLAGNPAVYSATAQVMTTGGRQYCMVNVTWRDPSMVGSAAGYAEPTATCSKDTFQSIDLAVALPLNTNTGDAAWAGRLIMTSQGGAQGTLPNLTSYIQMNPAAIGAGSDSGHKVGNDTTRDWGVIVSPCTPVGLNYGKIEDWAGGRSAYITVKLAKNLAQTYYGTLVARTYWSACSGGGQQGWAQVQNYPEEYDGAVVGSTAIYYAQFKLAHSWDEVVKKKVAQQTDAITQGQLNAANAAANTACAAIDGVTVNGTPIMMDPRACTWSATNNICGRPGAPAAPNCLNEIQAAGIDRIWDGPRNSFGKRIWFPNGRGIDLGVDTQPDTSGQQIMHWAHLDPNFDTTNLYEDAESIALAAAAGIDVTNAITFEEEAVLASRMTADYTSTDSLDLNTRIKMIVYHGTQDQLIMFADNIDFYLRGAAHFGGVHRILANYFLGTASS